MSDQQSVHLIRCFYVRANSMGVVNYAIDEDGKTVAFHCSSHESFSQHDIGVTSSWYHDAYRKRYPEGYRVEWVGEPPKDWEHSTAPDESEKLLLLAVFCRDLSVTHRFAFDCNERDALREAGELLFNQSGGLHAP